ncbi:MAG: hypothetical protein QOF69_2396 [Solirubrobacteraceae bacterium]|nr:hypothetical protein [Solirubrobacteraceae bacterium]
MGHVKPTDSLAPDADTHNAQHCKTVTRTSVWHLVDTVLQPGVVKIRRAIIGTLERRAHISTTGAITPQALGLPSESVGYMPSSWTTLSRILKRSEVEGDDVFIDFGSGMGRVLYQAAMGYPFRRVEGVEMSADLTAVARENLDRGRGSHRFRCDDIRLVTCDVHDYEIPDDLTIAYFYNPFRGAIFQSIVDRLVASVQRHPRRLRVIYLNPLEEKRLLKAGFREVRRLRGVRPGQQARARMYELAPPKITARPAASAP